MADNSNPQGTGTDTQAQADADFMAFLVDSQPSNPEQEPDEANATAQVADDENSEDGEQQPQNIEDQILTLPNGEQVKWGDLQKQRMQEADYTQKLQVHSKEKEQVTATTARLTEQARMIDEQAKQLETAFANTLDYAQSLIPPLPDANLALTNTNAYIYQKAQHDQALSSFQNIVNARQAMMNEMAQKANANQAQIRQVELAKLEEALPHLKGNPQKLEEFDKAAISRLKSYGIQNVERDWPNAPASMKKLVADFLRLEGQAKARTAPANGQQQPAPAAKVTPRTSANPESVKAIQAFRNTGSAADARKALSSDAFDRFLK